MKGLPRNAAVRPYRYAKRLFGELRDPQCRAMVAETTACKVCAEMKKAEEGMAAMAVMRRRSEDRALSPPEGRPVAGQKRGAAVPYVAGAQCTTRRTAMSLLFQ